MNQIKASVAGATAPIPDETLRTIEKPQVDAKPGPEVQSQSRADGTHDFIPSGPQQIMQARGLPNDAIRAPMLTGHEALMHHERIIEQNLAREDEIAMSLLTIYEGKLYKLTHAFFGEYLKQRWELSRSRGYQLLHLARLRRSRLLKGQPPPLNERQARRFAVDGTRLPQKPDENSYERRLHRVRDYVAANLAKLPPGEHRRFLQEVRKELDHLERQLDTQPPPHSHGSACVDTQPLGCARPAVTTSRTPRQPNRPLSASPARPQHVGATVEVKGDGQSTLSVTTAGSHAKGLQANHQPGIGNAQERPCPHGNPGSVLGLSMEQARRFGYCPE